MPLFYQTIWFRLGGALAACALIWGGYRLRMPHVVARYQLVGQERARLTREIHDLLLQGFAGVVLQLDQPEVSKDHLDRALEQADPSLREAG